MRGSPEERLDRNVAALGASPQEPSVLPADKNENAGE